MILLDVFDIAWLYTSYYSPRSSLFLTAPTNDIRITWLVDLLLNLIHLFDFIYYLTYYGCEVSMQEIFSRGLSKE